MIITVDGMIISLFLSNIAELLTYYAFYWIIRHCCILKAFRQYALCSIIIEDMIVNMSIEGYGANSNGYDMITLFI